jgi:uncharacterized oligopeptide transporter (OPT) family protein
MRERLKYAFIGLGLGFVPGLFFGLYVVVGVPGSWMVLAAIVAASMLSGALIGLLFPDKAESIFREHVYTTPRSLTTTVVAAKKG